MSTNHNDFLVVRVPQHTILGPAVQFNHKNFQVFVQSALKP